MAFDLRGRRIAITAGGRGIGRVTAERFAAAGARVAVCDIDEAAVSDCRARNPAMLVVKVDVANSQQVEQFYRDIERHLSGLDVLINNAGISRPTQPVEDITDEEWNRTLAVNITGQFYMARRAVPLFKAQRAGVIVNISSVPGLINGPRGRRVMTEQANARGMSFEQYLPLVLHNISIHMMIEMDEVADMAIFLASDSARHITGQSISVCRNFETYRAPLQNG